MARCRAFTAMNESFHHLTPEEFIRLKRINRAALIEWIYPVAVNATKFLEDLTDEERSDAFTRDIEKFYRALDHASNPGEFANYVKQGVVWKALDILRKKNRRCRREVSIDAHDENDEKPGKPNEVARAEGKVAGAAAKHAASEVEIRDLRKTVRQHLEPADQELLGMIEGGRLTPDEICRILGIKMEAFDTRKSRLKARIKKVLYELDEIRT